MQSLKELGELCAAIGCYSVFWYGRPKLARRAITPAEKLVLALVLVAGLLGAMMIVFHLDHP